MPDRTVELGHNRLDKPFEGANCGGGVQESGGLVGSPHRVRGTPGSLMSLEHAISKVIS